MLSSTSKTLENSQDKGIPRRATECAFESLKVTVPDCLNFSECRSEALTPLSKEVSLINHPKGDPAILVELFQTSDVVSHSLR